jgi:hypothetical protein
VKTSLQNCPFDWVGFAEAVVAFAHRQCVHKPLPSLYTVLIYLYLDVVLSFIRWSENHFAVWVIRQELVGQQRDLSVVSLRWCEIAARRVNLKTMPEVYQLRTQIRRFHEVSDVDCTDTEILAMQGMIEDVSSLQFRHFAPLQL